MSKESAEGISVTLVWGILHEITLYITYCSCSLIVLLTLVQGWCLANGFTQNVL
jgi:hypothetical protein